MSAAPNITTERKPELKRPKFTHIVDPVTPTKRLCGGPTVKPHDWPPTSELCVVCVAECDRRFPGWLPS